MTTKELDFVRNHLGVPLQASLERMCAMWGLPSRSILDGPPMFAGVDFYMGDRVPYPAPLPTQYRPGGVIAPWAGGFSSPYQEIWDGALLTRAQVQERFGWPDPLGDLAAAVASARESYARPRPQMGWYVPDGDGARQVSDFEFLETSRGTGEGFRRIAQDVVRSRGVRWWVSTVFLSIDHNYRWGPNADPRPVLWETMIFAQHLRPRARMFADDRGAVDTSEYGDEFVDHQSCWRYHSRSGAKLGHAAVLRALRAGKHVRNLELPDRW